MTNPALSREAEIIESLLPSLKERFGVGNLWIIGSRARGDHRPDSDLDLMVEFDRPDISLFGFAALEGEIAAAVGLKVDLVERGAPKPRVAHEIERDKVLI